ncbi:hypothetical protein NL533_33395, partial [Klebsiella pneumoniae]|nr:hypothetical protein [Klebsiella pneumoniae]
MIDKLDQGFNIWELCAVKYVGFPVFLLNRTGGIITGKDKWDLFPLHRIVSLGYHVEENERGFWETLVGDFNHGT